MTGRVWRPCSPSELASLRRARPGAILVAGGTVAVPAVVRDTVDRDVILTGRIEEMRTVRSGGCGADVRLAQVAADDRLPAGLRRAALLIGGPAVRNRATVGGNVGLGAPGCLAAALLALDATAHLADGESLPVAEVVGTAGRRPIAEFRWAPTRRCEFVKLTVGGQPSATIVNVAVGWSGSFGDLRIAAGFGDRPARIRYAEKLLTRDGGLASDYSVAADLDAPADAAYRTALLRDAVRRIGARPCD